MRKDVTGGWRGQRKSQDNELDYQMGWVGQVAYME